MSKQLIKEINQYCKLFRCEESGIAWVENESTGNGHSCHPNIHVTGSVAGMKKLGYWGKTDRTVKAHGYIYNIDKLVVDDELDKIAQQYCRCGGKH
ncbi:hypothetical protein BR63_03360 [Thermanaerosceptrum fracticalcis]|uniref:Uncharacterized protein n=1 Tax=Thermanaerosceptrum fracticalcis TaxID=1712410 RepID=A0A7G6E034_THEFR|nr:hypothetical protein [Thermanaerosceptrum fracticalcis]QNB45438.1 hypothetical protein BR63_03360 [Thermanaerosceptrum fracticalcis]